MNDRLENTFFHSAVQALVQEDHELSDLFEQNGARYENQHNGIACLYETTMVYLIMKRLLKDRFPLTVFWEYPYPDHPAWKADLGLLNEDRTLNSMVEFKLWQTDKAREIIGDVRKLQSSSFHGDKYLFVIEPLGGDIIDNLKFMNDIPNAAVIRDEVFFTRAFVSAHQQLEVVCTNVYLLRITP